MLIVQHFLYSSVLFKITFCLYFLALVAYACAFVVYVLEGRFDVRPRSFSWKKYVLVFASFCFVVALLSNIVLVVDRWIEAQRPPFRTLYETLIYATLTISLVYFFVDIFFKMRIFGMLVCFLVVFIFLYALSKRDVEIVTMMPALQTPIMVPHVTSYFFAYAGASLAFISAVLSLVLRKGIPGYWLISSQKQIHFTGYTYRIAKFTFLFLTFGILLGSWWGQIAWSDYWGWDPKENWALVSWLGFAVYLHLRKSGRWPEQTLAWIVIGCFSAILFTYLGMQYLPKNVQESSLHIYIED